METIDNASLYKPDSAAVFAAAMSLWHECHKQADRSINPKVRLSESYDGHDGLMREVMRVATLFESWACTHINFDELNEVWPYLLEERFGRESLSIFLPDGLAAFDESDCLRIAARLRLSLR